MIAVSTVNTLEQHKEGKKGSNTDLFEPGPINLH